MLFSVLQVCLWIRTLRVIVISPEQPSCPYGTLYLLTLNTADTSLTFPFFFLFSFSRTPFFILYKWFSRESSHLSETQHVSVMVGDSGGCQNSFDCSSISRMNSIPLEDSRWIDFFMMLVESAVNVLSPKSPALCFFRGHNMWERVTAKIERLLINISVTQEII